MPDFLQFFTQMDKEARRAILVVLVMFGLVLAILVFGKTSLTTDQETYRAFFDGLSQSRWAVFWVILTFAGAAFLGVPQWVLIAGTVLAFGPVYGSVYAWLATMISASLDFWLGRFVGAEKVRRFGGDLVGRIIGVIQRNGFVTSFAVRFVPTGPFVLVNMAAGVSGMRFIYFAAGTALGILPKILVVGLLAKGLLSGAQGDQLMIAFVILALLFIAVMLLARKRLKRHVVFDPQYAKKPDE